MTRIVHRDLKPANIFLCRSGPEPCLAKVLDFGIAKSSAHASSLQTGSMVVMGTPAYMAPEQARGRGASADARADQFALGAVLYEMLSGRPAFLRAGDEPLMTLVRVVTEAAPPLGDPRLDAVVQRALDKDPEQRYATISGFAEAVRAVLGGSSSVVMPVAGPSVPEMSSPPAEAGGSSATVLQTTNRRGELLRGPPLPRPVTTSLLAGGVILVALGLGLGRPGFLRADRREPAEGTTEPAAAGAPLPDLAASLDLVPSTGGPEPVVSARSAAAPESGAAKEASGNGDTEGAGDSAPAPNPRPFLPSGSVGGERGGGPPKSPVRTVRRAHAGYGNAGVVLRGVDPESPAAHHIRDCLREAFGESLGSYVDTCIELRRSHRLSVIRHGAPPRIERQIDDCVGELDPVMTALPASVTACVRPAAAAGKGRP